MNIHSQIYKYYNFINILYTTLFAGKKISSKFYNEFHEI